MDKKLLLITITVLLIGCSGKKTDQETAIVVNKHAISKTEVERTSEVIRQGILEMNPQQALMGMPSDLRKSAARQCVANELLLEEANRRGIKSDSAKVDSAIIKIKSRFSDLAAFQRELTAMGETEESMKKQFFDGQKLDVLFQQLLKNIDTVSIAQCKEYYDINSSKYLSGSRIRASQIFFPLDSASDSLKKSNVMKKANEVVVLAKAGKDFSSLAKKYSSGPEAASGGDIGWFKRGDLKPELEQPLGELKTGEVSGVITSSAGLHIIKKAEVDSGKPLSFDEVKGHIKVMLDLKKRNDYISTFIDSLIQKSTIKYYDTSLVPLADEFSSSNGR